MEEDSLKKQGKGQAKKMSTVAECVVFANCKGGTGKTTSCLSIAGYLAKSGSKVLVVDFDPQANATSGLGIETLTLKYSMYDAVLDQCDGYEGVPITQVILETDVENLHIAPSELDLAVAGETTELDIMQKGGKTAVAEMRVVETEWEREIAHLASLRDITERKRAEEKLHELDRMKSEFIANISHELRTPLHSIRGFTKLMLGGKVPDPETQKEFLSTIDKQSERLGKLIDSLLDMSRLESGRFRIQKQRLPIKDIIHETVGSFYTLVSEKGTVINEDIPATLPEIEADGERVRQVMVNLLSNAIKFSNDGGSVTVKGNVNDSELLVQVTDRGIGIPKEAMPHLFERFYRAQDSMARGGAGLGLYISKQIIEAHGGRIWAESKVGEGSTFSFTLPLNQSGGDSPE